MSAAAERAIHYELTANKTKLYELARRYYPALPPRKEGDFIKYPRVRSYSLDFFTRDYYYHFYFSVCGGRAVLALQMREYDEEGEAVTNWTTYPLTIEELKELGLVEVTTA
ncbi:MAG: hypothetical protein IJP67_05205 [Oscillospiraceae bacterium]|nr:hypothetical protein [Oscillospiraceae bacterium]